MTRRDPRIASFLLCFARSCGPVPAWPGLSHSGSRFFSTRVAPGRCMATAARPERSYERARRSAEYIGDTSCCPAFRETRLVRRWEARNTAVCAPGLSDSSSTRRARTLSGLDRSPGPGGQHSPAHKSAIKCVCPLCRRPNRSRPCSSSESFIARTPTRGFMKSREPAN